MKLKMIFKKGLVIATIYFFAMVMVLMMAERVERLEEKSKLEKDYNVAVNIDK